MTDMLAHFSAAELMLLAGGAIIAACCAGLSAGLLGIGGGFIVVPALYYLLTLAGTESGAALHCAVATSLAIIVITGSSSAAAHYRRGAVDVPMLVLWLPALSAGVIAGSLIAGLVQGRVLALAFAAAAFFVAFRMAFTSDEHVASRIAPNGAVNRAFLPGGIGMLSAMTGIGGGAFGVLAFSLSGMNMPRAVATSSGLGPVIGLLAAVFFAAAGWNQQGLPPFSLGYVNLPAFLLFAPITALTAPLGARIAHALPRNTLRRIFALFCACAACRLLYDAF